MKAGDILVFKAGNDWVGRSIAWLTESDVSHAAMMLDGGRMVEMGLSGISVSRVSIVDGDKAVVLRLNPAQDPAPLLREAQKYVDSETRYDLPALALLAGLIIYRRIRPTKRFVAITDVILRAATTMLDKLIQQLILKNPDKAMVCSQLVYQVYEDCGKGYHIAIKGGLLNAADALDRADSAGIRLADLAQSAPDLDFAAAPGAAPLNEEALAEELYAALTESETADDMDFAALDLGTLPSWVNRFLEKLKEFLEKSGSDLPIDALFITPADLAYKAVNLKTICRTDIVRSR